MIDDDNDSYDGGGKYEHPNFQRINRDILQLPDWRVKHLRPSDCPSHVTHDQQHSMRMLIQRQEDRYDDWGFKDPRTVVTYPLWRSLLPRHRIIAVFRDPAGNWKRHRWRGLRRRYVNAWRAYQHLRQWWEYNTAILEYAGESANDFLLLNYEQLMSDDNELTRLSRFIGRPVADRREPSLFRTRTKPDVVFRATRWAMNTGSVYRIDALWNSLMSARVACAVESQGAHDVPGAG